MGGASRQFNPLLYFMPMLEQEFFVPFVDELPF